MQYAHKGKKNGSAMITSLEILNTLQLEEKM